MKKENILEASTVLHNIVQTNVRQHQTTSDNNNNTYFTFPATEFFRAGDGNERVNDVIQPVE